MNVKRVLHGLGADEQKNASELIGTAAAVCVSLYVREEERLRVAD